MPSPAAAGGGLRRVGVWYVIAKLLATPARDRRGADHLTCGSPGVASGTSAVARSACRASLWHRPRQHRARRAILPPLCPLRNWVVQIAGVERVTAPDALDRHPAAAQQS